MGTAGDFTIKIRGAMRHDDNPLHMRRLNMDYRAMPGNDEGAGIL